MKTLHFFKVHLRGFEPLTFGSVGDLVHDEKTHFFPGNIAFIRDRNPCKVYRKIAAICKVFGTIPGRFGNIPGLITYRLFAGKVGTGISVLRSACRPARLSAKINPTYCKDINNASRRDLIIAVLPAYLHGQTKGSASAYRAAADMQRSGIASAIALEERNAELKTAWESAIKLTLGQPTDNLPLPQRPDDLDLRNVRQGDSGRLSSWSMRVVSVIDVSTLLVACEELDIGFWVEGLPTKDLATNDKIRVIDYVEADGTNDYNTTNGQKTVRRLRVLPFAETQARLIVDGKKAEERTAELAKLAAEKEASKERDYRNWTAEKGGKTVNGKFVRYSYPNLQIEMRDGKKVSVRLALLIESDVELAKRLTALSKETR